MEQQGDDIGARVRMVRRYAGLSQDALADAIGVERRIVHHIEKNARRHPLRVCEAQSIARVCAGDTATERQLLWLIVWGWRDGEEPPIPQLPGPPGELGRDL